MASLHIIYASTSGSTEYVIDTLVNYLKEKAKDLAVTVQLAETAQAPDLLRGDILLLASATWNLDALEGHLNPHMHDFLTKRAKDADLGGKPVGLIALGDDRYYYSCRATERFMQYFTKHNAKPSFPPLLVVNDPYGQEERVTKWADKFLEALPKALASRVKI